MLPIDKRARVIAALRINPNASQVAQTIGDIDRSTVRRIAKAAGIELVGGHAKRGHHRVTPEKRALIVTALRDNPNASQVSRDIGEVSRMTVWKIAKAAGISLPADRATRTGP
jgi:hypothetical protein